MVDSTVVRNTVMHNGKLVLLSILVSYTSSSAAATSYKIQNEKVVNLRILEWLIEPNIQMYIAQTKGKCDIFRFRTI